MYQISLQIHHSYSNILTIWQDSSVSTGICCANLTVVKFSSWIHGERTELTEESGLQRQPDRHTGGIHLLSSLSSFVILFC